MKKLLVVLSLMSVCTIALATTVNLNWMVDNADYTQTTCETGGDLILPAAPPAKYGYTFRGWNLVDEIVTGTVTQNGTPSPSNPIYPTFYENNGMVLRAIGNVADTYSYATGIITRRVGVKVFNKTSYHWGYSSSGYPQIYITLTNVEGQLTAILSSHFQGYSGAWMSMSNDSVMLHGARMGFRYDDIINLEQWESWLADQYANGTPVTVYYPLAEPVQEIWTEQ